MRWVIVLIFVCLGFVQARGEDSSKSYLDEEEFEIKRQALQDRYQDFYIYYNEMGKDQASRQRFAEEQRKLRKQRKEDYEKSRRSHVENRVIESEMDRTAYERELAEQRKAYEITRKNYVLRQRELERLEKHIGVIPEEIEYELY